LRLTDVQTKSNQLGLFDDWRSKDFAGVDDNEQKEIRDQADDIRDLIQASEKLDDCKKGLQGLGLSDNAIQKIMVMISVRSLFPFVFLSPHCFRGGITATDLTPLLFRLLQIKPGTNQSIVWIL